MLRLLFSNARYRQIVLFFARLTLHVIVWEIVVRSLRLGALSRGTQRRRYRRAAQRFRALAARLGGVMIKVGQFLSTRVDVLPHYVTDELANLQDEAPPEPFERIRAVLEGELGEKLTQHFAHVDAQPLAAASLGQAHHATLTSGEEVVVKVQRPDIEVLVEIDLAALRVVSGWLKRYRPIRRRANVDALLAEFSAVLRQELDYVAEAAHARRFAEMFAGDDGVRIPRVYDDLTTRRVLTLEDVGYIKITDYAQLTALGLDRAEVADRLFKTYLTQIFTHGFFHADPHPGNLFVQPAGEDHGWRLVFVDFGMVGTITPQIRAALREGAIAVGTRDPARLIRAFQAVDALLPDADLDRIIAAQTEVFDRYWGKSMRELRQIDRREVARFTQQFRDLLFELPFQVPENLIYLGRTVAILSGMCTGLSPNFNVFVALTPFAQQLLAEETQGRNLDFWIDEALNVLRRLAALPARLDTALSRLEKGEFIITQKPTPEQAQQARALTRAINRFAGSVVCVGLLGAGTALYLNGQAALGVGGWGLAGAVLAWMLARE